MRDKFGEKSFWGPIIKKVRMKFAAWRCSSLSKAGRLVLINAVMDALPTHWFILFKPPVGVVQELERLKR